MNHLLDSIPNILFRFAEQSETVFWVRSPDFQQLLYLSPAFASIWGRDCGEVMANPELWLESVYCEDRLEFSPLEILAEKIEREKQNARYFEQYRIVRPNGEVRWINERFFPIFTNEQCIAIAGLASDVTETKRMEHALLAAKNAAETSARATSNFLTTVGHELRTPLNAVMGLTQILTMKQLPEVEQQDYLDIIYHSAKDVLHLINDMLDHARIEAGNLSMTDEVFNLHQYLQRIIRKYQYLAEEKGIPISLQVSDNVPEYVISDTQRFTQIISNLLDNAIKFTQKGEIVLMAHAQAHTDSVCHIHIRVKDTGIGIPEDQTQMIFQRFVQAHNQQTNPYVRRYKGLGLGLSIVKQLVNMLGGKISVKSQEGVGSEFNLSIPMSLANDTQDKQTSVNSPGQVLDCYILLVEDNELNQKVAQLMLKELGCEVRIASDGSQALALLNETEFNLVLMDLSLPDMSGIEVVKIMRLNGCELPIIGLTAFAQADDLQACLEAGMDDVLIKPLKLNRLKGALSQFRLKTTPLTVV